MTDRFEPAGESAFSEDRKPAATLRMVLRTPQGVIGVTIVAVFLLSALFAPAIAPYDPFQINIPDRLQAPSLNHLLGTDQLGRDTFSRILYGGRIAVQLAGIAVGLSLAIGLVLGMIAGYGPRWFDNLMLLLFDTIRSFPTIVMAMAVVSLTGPSLEMVMAIFVINAVPGFGRIARTQTLALRNTEFILAEHSLGASTALILRRHIMPNVVGPLLILAAMDVPVVITVEAGLSFLGLGVLPPTPSWGSLLNEGFRILRDTPWPVIAGGLPLIITTLGFTFLGESLRDVFDPKLRKEP
ncbi:MAG: ABC transporter permease [Albidovulum sp.]|nr:ABC transporter permease [Albidovulum sp.]